MSETRPRLEVVTDGTAPAPEARSAPPSDPGRRGWLLPALLAGALLVCAGGWILATQEGGRLQRQLAASEAALASTRADLGRAEGRLAAFEAHLGAARDRVGALALELGALDAFLAAGPGAAEAPAASPEPASPEPAPGP